MNATEAALLARALEMGFSRMTEVTESDDLLLCQTDTESVYACDDEGGRVIAAPLMHGDEWNALREEMESEGFVLIPDTYCQTIAYRIPW